MAEKFHVRKGDQVVVLAGKDKGKSGQILKVLRKEHRVVVEGVNLVKKHQKPAMGNPGGIVQKEASLHISNVSHKDPVSDKPTRIGYKFLDDGRKVRYAKRSGEVIE